MVRQSAGADAQPEQQPVLIAEVVLVLAVELVVVVAVEHDLEEHVDGTLASCW